MKIDPYLWITFNQRKSEFWLLKHLIFLYDSDIRNNHVKNIVTSMM